MARGSFEARPTLCWAVIVRGEGAVSEARSWQEWSSVLRGPESNVRQSQGAALEARPTLCWVVFVRGEGVSEA